MSLTHRGDGSRVVVAGLDGSGTSWRAAAYAVGPARRQEALLVLVRLWGAAGTRLIRAGRWPVVVVP